MGPITRREALRSATAGSLALTASGLLAACGSSASQNSTSASDTGGTPRRGGTLNAAITGGDSSDTIDPLNPINNADFSRVLNLFDPLIGQNPQGKPELVLAQEISPNRDATTWTIRVKRGIEFHDGKELTADDVIYTFRRILNPKSPGAAAAGLALIDAVGMKKRDKYTVEIPCKSPFATLEDSLAIAGYSSIVPVDFDPKKATGTGPFQLVSFTPGQQSTFARFPHYWRSGRPYLDKVVINDFSDETSQVNALLGGQADVVNLLSTDTLEQVKGAGKGVIISNGGGWNPFTLRVDLAPFSDVRVRQALRLTIDRKQLLETVYGGYGTIGNDVFGIWSSDYDHSLPQREPDVDQAKSLLKQAGHSDLSLQLVTADIAQGVTKSAQVFAQQATAAGIKVNLRQVTTTEFYGSSYLKWPFAQDYWYYNFYFPQVALATLPTSPFNETHFSDPTYVGLYKQAVSTVDADKRRQIGFDMQKIDYDQGGYIIPVFPPVIDGYGKNVHGLITSKSGLSLNSYQFGDIWVD
jgi:peptide/nickel transport system substrate-binding protein